MKKIIKWIILIILILCCVSFVSVNRSSLGEVCGSYDGANSDDEAADYNGYLDMSIEKLLGVVPYLDMVDVEAANPEIGGVIVRLTDKEMTLLLNPLATDLGLAGGWKKSRFGIILNLEYKITEDGIILKGYDREEPFRRYDS